MVPVPLTLERPHTGVRIPLQTGVSAVWNLTRAVLLLACPFLVLLPAVASPEGKLLTIVLAPTTLGVVAYGVISLLRALRQRMSDLVLDPVCIAVEGGPRHGTVVPWDELTVQEVDAEVHVEKRTTLAGIVLTSVLFWLVVILVIATGELGLLGGFDFVRLEVSVTRFGVQRDDGSVVWVAETDEGLEADSLRAARDSIRAVIHGRRDAAGGQPAVAVAIVTCADCGAPVPPADAPALRCEFCGVDVPIPSDMRSHIAAHEAVASQRVDLSPFLQAVFRQPRPLVRNRRLLWAGLAMAGCWLVGWALVLVRVSPHLLDAVDVALLVAPSTGVLAIAFHLRASLSERQAVQLLSLRFGALAPLRRGQPARCRRCHGALGRAGGLGLVTCLYCDADNVLGLDLRSVVDAARAEEASVGATVRRVRTERLKWRWLAAVAALLCFAWLGSATAVLLRVVWPQSPRASVSEFG